MFRPIQKSGWEFPPLSLFWWNSLGDQYFFTFFGSFFLMGRLKNAHPRPQILEGAARGGGGPWRVVQVVRGQHHLLAWRDGPGGPQVEALLRRDELEVRVRLLCK